MKLFNRARYGTQLFVDFAISGGEVSLSEFARLRQLSRFYLQNLVRPLEAEELINISQDSVGGIWLSQLLEKIKLGLVVRLLGGNSLLVRCVGDPGICCLADACPSRRIWAKIERTILRYPTRLQLAI